LSTLTKTLIILLTLSSIFLCGIVVTYVSSANNFKDAYRTEHDAKLTAQSKAKTAKIDLAERSDKFEQNLKNRIAEIADLQQQIEKLDDEKKELNRALVAARKTAENSAALAKTAGEISDGLQKTLDGKLTELKQALAKATEQDKQLNDVNADLITRIAVIDTLQTDKRRLEEETALLQVKLDQLLGKRGLEIGTTPKITPPLPDIVRLRIPEVSDTFVKPIALKGLINGLDIENSIAQISIGAANGVRPKMKFLVTRDSQFICEILIIDVEPEKAVGLIQRVKARAQPKVGDKVSTNL